MPKKPSEDNPKCPNCSNYPTIKWGVRKSKNRLTQKYQCRSCNHYFTAQPNLQKFKTYSLKTILNTISNYNLGKPLRTNRQIPSSTIHNWINELKTELPFNRLRNRIKNKPLDSIIIKKQFIHHKQPFLYQYHNLKIRFAKRFPGLIYYLKNINTLLPKDIFSSSERISEISRSEELKKKYTKKDRNLTIKQNYATKLADIALQITEDNKQRHNIIENFMLINDTATIATEIPVYIKENESKLNKPLTGHIDILQIRYHKLHILDFKPDIIKKEQAINQLRMYRKALSKTTKIPKHKFKLAFFNNKEYCEIR